MGVGWSDLTGPVGCGEKPDAFSQETGVVGGFGAEEQRDLTGVFTVCL